MAAPILLSLLIAAQTPEYDKSVAALEEAYRASPVPEILLSIAATYEAWPNHCRETIAAYQRFLDACPQCREHSRGAERFEAALNRCVTSADEEAALRERYLAPARQPPAPNPADALRSEVSDLLRRARSIDRSRVNELFVTMIEAGVDAPNQRWNELREEAWKILLRADADTEQALVVVGRMNAVDPVKYREELKALMAADQRDDVAALNAVRLRAIDFLRERATKGDAVAPAAESESCGVNLTNEVGFVTVMSKPWSEVYVNGEKVGSTPINRYPTPAGCAKLRFVDTVNGVERVQTIAVAPNKVSVFRIDLD